MMIAEKPKFSLSFLISTTCYQDDNGQSPFKAQYEICVYSLCVMHSMPVFYAPRLSATATSKQQHQ